ncbi:3D domain-containing protein [Candidatus Uhrbacteria bacterium]|nr:3D domain-containing protein [Candidatus Uhrbacteria bacterium]
MTKRYFPRLRLTFTERLFAVAVLAVTLQLSFPQYSHAAVPLQQTTTGAQSIFMETTVRDDGTALVSVPTPLVVAEESTTEKSVATASARRVMWVIVTAYSSEERQTDGSPYITAKNTFVRDGVIAANFLPFNTHVRMPTAFGDKLFVVEDRMNARYFEHIDIWMPTREAAKQWGSRWVKVEIL